MARRRRRSAMTRLFILLIGLILFVGGALFVASRLLSPDFIAGQLVAAVKQQTGRTLVIEGSPRISFWPELSVRLSGVSLSNPPSMGSGLFMKAGEIDLAVAARPLLQQRLEVRRIVLRKPTVNLLVDGKGRQNWDFSTTSGKAAVSGGEGDKTGGGDALKGLVNDIRIAPIVISGGKLRYLDERSATTFAADAVNLNISLPTPDAPLKLKGSVAWKKQPVKFTLFIKAPQRLAAAGSPLELALSTPRLEATYSGLMSLGKGFALAGRLEASSPSLRDLMRWLGVELPQQGRGLGAFSLKGGLAMTEKSLTLKKALLRLDGMAAQGTIRIQTGGKRPKIIAALGMDKIDTNVYLPPLSEKDKAAENTGGAANVAANVPVDFAPLAALDADLRLAVNQILYRKVRIGRSRLAVKLSGGVMDAKLEEMAFYGGKASGRLVLDGSGRKPRINGRLRASGLDGQALLRDFAAMERLRGRLDMNMAITASGSASQEMLTTMDGTAAFRFADGSIKGINIARLIRTVKKSIVNGWKKSPTEKTDFAELSASFTIRDGIAATSDLKMLGPLVRLFGKGEVDIPRRYLDMRIKPKLVGSLKGQGGKEKLTGLPVPVIVKGPWDNPKIYPDIEGILKDPEAAYEKLKGLIGKLKGRNAAETLGKARDKATAAVKKQQEKLEKKAQDELGKAIGDENAQKAVKKGKKKAKKLLRKFLQ